VAELRLPDAIEHPLLLGEEGARVFGMLCQPTGATHEQKATHSGTRPAVLICNTGANPHYGYGRLAVALARELARDGVASLRLDPAGIGDSDGASTVSLPDMYTDRGDDLRAATDLLERRGYGRVVVFGICTGAYHAFHAAQHDDRIAGVVLVNQIVYRWRTNPILFRAEVIARALIGRLRGDKSLDAEQELLRLRIAPPNPTKNKLRRMVLRAGVVAERMVLRPFGLHTVLTLPERSLKDLAARGVRMLAVAGQDDYGRSLLQVQFGPDFSGSRAVPGLCVRIEPEFDHPVGQSGARARLIALVRSFVAEFAPAAAFPAAEPTLRPATHARG
jgi:pimeloyl-ACP methyl ester carboxylesterase